MLVRDLGTMPYREAWALQEEAHAQVLGGAEERILLVEHPPVITFGRRPGADVNVIASSRVLSKRGVEVVQSDRGGNVTFHGPGQIVAYPILRLKDHGMSVSCYVHRLEDGVIAALAELNIESRRDRAAIGVWVGESKICAIGVRISRGVTLHGLALNVTTALNYFDLIVPCGLAGKSVTSLAKLLGDFTPSVEAVKVLLAQHLLSTFSQRIETAQFNR